VPRLLDRLQVLIDLDGITLPGPLEPWSVSQRRVTLGRNEYCHAAQYGDVVIAAHPRRTSDCPAALYLHSHRPLGVALIHRGDCPLVITQEQQQVCPNELHLGTDFRQPHI
jgi:hypothetical protein